MYNVCHNIYRNFPPNWMAQISVGYTLRGAFKTPFLENSENIPTTNPNTQEKALHQAGQVTTMTVEARGKAAWSQQRWSYYMRKTNSVDAFHQEAISGSALQKRQWNNTLPETLQRWMTNEIWHELSEYEIQQNVNTIPVSRNFLAVCSTVQYCISHVWFHTAYSLKESGTPLGAVFVLMRSEHRELPQCNDMNIQCYPRQAANLFQGETYWFEFWPSSTSRTNTITWFQPFPI